MLLTTFGRTFFSTESLPRTCLILILASCGSMAPGTAEDAHGQETPSACIDTLEAAEEAYRNRNYQEAITLASECTDRGAYNETTVIQAYRMMGLGFLRQGTLRQARSAILNILAIDPTYMADPVTDPPSYDLFVSLVRQEMDVDSSEPVPSTEQDPRTGGNFFLKALGIGLSDYTGEFPGDRVGHPFDMREFPEPDGFPYVFSFELGYHVSQKFALVLAFQGGNYPTIGYSGPTRLDSHRYTPQLLARYMLGDPNGTVTPYVDGGYNVTFGGDSSTQPGYGPSLGAGLDIVLSRSTSLYVESRFNLTVPDEAIDGLDNLDPNFKGSITGTFDSVNQLLGIGIRVDLGDLSGTTSSNSQSD